MDTVDRVTSGSVVTATSSSLWSGTVWSGGLAAAARALIGPNIVRIDCSIVGTSMSPTAITAMRSGRYQVS